MVIHAAQNDRVAALRRQSGFVAARLDDREKLRYLDEVCRAPRVVLRSTSLAAQLHAVAAGEGLAILPLFMSQEYPNLEVVLGDQIRLVRSFWILTHAELKDLARVKLVWNYLKEIVAREQSLLLGTDARR